MLREKSDYEDFYVADEQDTKDIIEQVRMFLDEVKNYLMNKSVF